MKTNDLIIVEEYFNVPVEIVWDAISNDVLKTCVSKLSEHLDVNSTSFLNWRMSKNEGSPVRC